MAQVDGPLPSSASSMTISSSSTPDEISSTKSKEEARRSILKLRAEKRTSQAAAFNAAAPLSSPSLTPPVLIRSTSSAESDALVFQFNAAQRRADSLQADLTQLTVTNEALVKQIAELKAALAVSEERRESSETCLTALREFMSGEQDENTKLNLPPLPTDDLTFSDTLGNGSNGNNNSSSNAGGSRWGSLWSKPATPSVHSNADVPQSRPQSTEPSTSQSPLPLPSPPIQNRSASRGISSFWSAASSIAASAVSSAAALHSTSTSSTTAANTANTTATSSIAGSASSPAPSLKEKSTSQSSAANDNSELKSAIDTPLPMSSPPFKSLEHSSLSSNIDPADLKDPTISPSAESTETAPGFVGPAFT